MRFGIHMILPVGLKTYNYQDEEQTNFELDVSNKTIKMRANITDPFGGYDVNMVKLTLKGPTDNIILDNVTMTKVVGTPINFVNIYETIWNYTGVPIGQYEVTVWAVDNNGYYYYYHKEKYNFGPYPEINSIKFFIGGLPQLGLIKVKDSGSPQAPLPGAVVKVMKGSRVIYTNITNSMGEAGINTY